MSSLPTSATIGEILKAAESKVAELGMQLVDVHVDLEIDLPEEVSKLIFSRMQQDFERQAKQLRAEGDENAEKLRAEADRQKTEIQAKASEVEMIRGEGDAGAAETYARAYSRDAEFSSGACRPRRYTRRRQRHAGHRARQQVLQYLEACRAPLTSPAVGLWAWSTCWRQ